MKEIQVRCGEVRRGQRCNKLLCIVTAMSEGSEIIVRCPACKKDTKVNKGLTDTL